MMNAENNMALWQEVETLCLTQAKKALEGCMFNEAHDLIKSAIEIYMSGASGIPQGFGFGAGEECGTDGRF